MSTSQEYINFVLEQLDGIDGVSYKKMFGEYMVYVGEKPILLVCDNCVMVKKLPELDELMKDAPEDYPYEGAKAHYVLDIENRKLMRDTGCDVWFPFYPLCMEHCITDTYEMAYECYRRMIELYGGGNVSTCGFSSGGALALGIAAHNNALGKPLPQPRHIVAVSPGEVPWNDAEKARMQALNEKDVAIDYAFMVTVEKFMRHGQENVPDYMISGSRGDFSGVGDIHSKS